MRKLAMCAAAGAAAVAVTTGMVLTAGDEGTRKANAVAGKEESAKDRGAGPTLYAGYRNVNVKVKGGKLRGVIKWNYNFAGESSLKVWGTVTSTGNGCAQARLHSQEVLIGQGLSYDTNDDGFPDRFEEPVVRGQRHDFLLKPVCGSGKSRKFDRTWELKRVDGRAKLWMDVWLGLKTKQAWSGWK